MRLKIFFIVLLFYLLPTSIFAQTVSDDFPIVGITAEYPEDWTTNVIEISEGVFALYLTDSDDTLDAILSNPTEPMEAGTVSLIHYPPALVSQFGATLEEAQDALRVETWNDITLNDTLAYQSTYEDARTQGFLLLHELSDGQFALAVADTAVGEMTNELEAQLLELIDSVEPFSTLSLLEGELDYSETVESDNLSFIFQYPEEWSVSEIEQYPNGLFLSPVMSFSSFDDITGQASIIVTEHDLNDMGIADLSALIPGEISINILETYVDNASGDGVEFSDVEIIEIGDVEVGVVRGENVPTSYWITMSETTIAQFLTYTESLEVKVAFENIIQEMIPTLQLREQENPRTLPPSNTDTIRITDLAATFTMSNDIEFDYPEDWSAVEDEGLVLVSNLDEIEEFEANEDQVLFIISAVPTEERDVAATIVQLQSIVAVLSERPDFDVNIFRIDESDLVSDIEFDVGDPGIDWDFSGALISTSDGALNGSVFVIMNLDDYSPDYATSLINPIMETFRLSDSE